MKVRIEMDVPDTMDLSSVLELAQEFAVQLYEDFPDEDEDGEDIELDEDAKEAVRVEVSVEEVKCAHDGAYFTAGQVEAKHCAKCHGIFL